MSTVCAPLPIEDAIIPAVQRPSDQEVVDQMEASWQLLAAERDAVLEKADLCQFMAEVTAAVFDFVCDLALGAVSYAEVELINAERPDDIGAPAPELPPVAFANWVSELYVGLYQDYFNAMFAEHRAA